MQMNSFLLRITHPSRAYIVSFSCLCSPLCSVKVILSHTRLPRIVHDSSSPQVLCVYSKH